MIPPTIFLRQRLPAAFAGPRDCSLHSVWIHIFIRDVKKMLFGIIRLVIFAIYFMTKYSGILLVMM